MNNTGRVSSFSAAISVYDALYIKYTGIFIFLTCILYSCATVKTPNQYKANPDFHLYLLMGQSNMAGRGPLNDSLRELHNDRIWMLSKENKWVVAHHPIHFDKPIAEVGPGLSFAMEMLKVNPGIQIGLIPCAVGGTSIEKWQPGVVDTITTTHPYDDAVNRIREGMQYGTIKGMLWLQGEADSNEAAIPPYLEKFKVLIERIRDLTGQPDLPVVAGELGQFNPQYELFNQELNKLPELVPHTAVAHSENLTDKGDQVHFDASSANEYGVRFARQMKQLQQNLTQQK